MTITVPSPHSGRPVKVREQDVGRAVRDEEGRIFYVLPKRESEGYYGARTRTGSDKDELQSSELEQSVADEREADRPLPHDATGRKRSNWRTRAMIVAVVAIIALLAYLFGWRTLGLRDQGTGSVHHDAPPPTDERVIEAPDPTGQPVP